MPILTINPKGLAGDLEDREVEITSGSKILASNSTTFLPNDVKITLKKEGPTTIELPVTPTGGNLYFKWGGTFFKFQMPNRDVTLAELIRGSDG